MEQDKKTPEPDSSAVRVALWRALHVIVDSSPHIFEDEIGLKLAAPNSDWRQRGDMHPEALKRIRASIVARSRFIEDVVAEQSKQRVSQYVILGAGLDTFAQRKPEIASKLQVFEIDQPNTQEWKKQRLTECGIQIPKWLHFVPVDFESGSSWLKQLITAGFDITQPAFVASAGVTLYLTKEAIMDSLHKVASFAPGSKLAMTFYLPMELLDMEDRPMQELAEEGARVAGTPFVSFFAPDEILAMAREAGFKTAEHVSRDEIAKRYFNGRIDNLYPASGEEFLIAST